MTFDEKVELLHSYFKESNSKYIPSNLIYRGVNLGKWATNTRYNYHKGNITQKSIAKLESVGFDFNQDKADMLWMKHFEFLKEYFRKTQSNYIPVSLLDSDGILIYKWAFRQIDAYRQGILSEDKINLLKSIDFPFHGNNKSSSIEESVFYYYSNSLFGDKNVSTRDKRFGVELDVFILKNNVNIGIEYDGVYSRRDKQIKDIRKTNKCIKNGIHLFRIRHADCGSLNITNDFYHEYIIQVNKGNIFETKEFLYIVKEVLKDISDLLGIRYECDVNIERDIQEISDLRAGLSSAQWYKMYYELKDIYLEHGYIPLAKTDNNRYCVWVCQQRQAYKNGTLQQNRIKLLEELIPCGFSWLNPNGWQIRYEAYVDYISKYGQPRKLPHRIKHNGVDIQRWEHNNRVNYAQGKLSEDKIKLLEEINFNFTEPDFWERSFNCYLECREKIGQLHIPHGIKYKGMDCGKWECDQRSLYNTGKLDKRKVDLLKSHDFLFSLT